MRSDIWAMAVVALVCVALGAVGHGCMASDEQHSAAAPVKQVPDYPVGPSIEFREDYKGRYLFIGYAQKGPDACDARAEEMRDRLDAPSDSSDSLPLPKAVDLVSDPSSDPLPSRDPPQPSSVDDPSGD